MEIFNPEFIIQYGGLTLLLLIIFAESGLFFGFFLPGDSLLFVAGLLSRTPYFDQPVLPLICALFIAAVAGATVGYLFGGWAGNRLGAMADGLFFKRKYLDATRSFYRKYGLGSLIAGRFLPVVRTFIPILAGLVKLDFRSFLVFNVAGAALWVGSFVLLGRWLGSTFPSVFDHVELVIAGIVMLTTLPVVIGYLKQRAI